MKKILILAALAGMIAANAEAINTNLNPKTDINDAITAPDSDVNVSSKNWSLSGLIGARDERFGIDQASAIRAIFTPAFPPSLRADVMHGKAICKLMP